MINFPPRLKRFILERRCYLLCFLFSIGLGLLSRSSLVPLPPFIATYAGDTIWAAMVFFLGGCLWPDGKKWQLAIAALAFSWAIEFSQLYQSPWLNHLRNYRLGGLILGFGFKSSDLICYMIGILMAVVIVQFLAKIKVHPFKNK